MKPIGKRGSHAGVAAWRTARLAARALLLVLLAACASKPQGGPSLEELRAARRKADVVLLTTQPPLRCTWSRPGHELCTWRFANRQSEWWVLAPSIGTRHQVNFVCEFRSDGSPAERECEVVPRAAQPFEGAPAVASAEQEKQGARRWKKHVERGAAWREIEAARTTAQMSRLVGDIPDHCARLDEATQLCAWEAGKAHRGYGVLSVAADTDSRVVLSCSFPSDGSERPAESCRVQPR